MQKVQLEQGVLEENSAEVNRLGIQIDWNRRYMKGEPSKWAM